MYSIGAVTSAGSLASARLPHEPDPLVLTGPRRRLRYATREDVPRLFDLGADPAVTRFFSWGPYTTIDEPEAYVASLPARRAAGELLDFLIEDPDDGVIGITGLSELVRRDRRATVGSWLGHRWWGSGANREAKAMICALAFRWMGIERLTAWSSTRNGRSQAALERIGFRREGVLAAWHRHGDRVNDVVVYGMTRAGWERSPLHAVDVTIEGTVPLAWIVG